jgi:hypothetical protein
MDDVQTGRRAIREVPPSTRSTVADQRLARSNRAIGLGAVAFGAFALGATAIGALAIGRLAVGAFAMKRGHVRTLTVENLEVRPPAYWRSDNRQRRAAWARVSPGSPLHVRVHEPA